MRPVLVMLAALSLAACAPAAAPTAEVAADAAADAAAEATSEASQTARIEPAAANGKRIELVNNARRGTLVRLEVAPIADRENFREVVAARGLPAGDERNLRLGPGCVYDGRAVMEDGKTLTQFRLDVCFRNRVFLGDWPALNEPPMVSGQAPQ